VRAFSLAVRVGVGEELVRGVMAMVGVFFISCFGVCLSMLGLCDYVQVSSGSGKCRGTVFSYILKENVLYLTSGA
jgi:hypothetical protein